MSDLASAYAEIEQRTEILFERKRAGGLDRFRRYADDPAGFIEDVLGAKLWSAQREICEAIRTEPRVAVRSAHGMGKDFLGARLLLWFVYARAGLAIATANTERQLVGIIMRGEVQDAFRRAKGLPGKLYTQSLRIDGRDRLIAFPSQSVDTMTGWHDENVMVLISEGQGEAVEDAAYDAAFAIATSAGSRILALGNPVRAHGRFFEINRSPNWRAVRISAYDHPNIATGEKVIAKGPDPSWPRAVIAEYGADSDYVRARIEGEFPSQSIEQLIRREWVEDAVRRWREIERWDGPVTLGVDVARFGSDRSALALLQSDAIREVETWASADTMETAERINRRAHALRQAGTPPRIAVDEIGLGAGVVDRLRELGHAVSGFNAARRADETSRFANRRSEAYWRLRRALELRRLALPPDQDLEAELLAHEWTIDGQGRIQVVGKDEVRTKIKRSPDRADAVAIAHFSSRRGTGLPAGALTGFVRPSSWRVI